MCDAVSITAGVLTVAGLAASAYGSSQAQSARDSQVNNEAAIQSRIANDGQNAFGNVLGDFTQQNQSSQQQNAANTRQSAITSAITPPTAGALPTDGMSSTAPRIVGQTAAADTSANKAIADNEGNALARIGSFGDLMTNNSIALNRGSQNIGLIASKAQGQANLLPLRLQGANEVGGTARTLGSLLSTTGSALGSYAGATGALANDAGTIYTPAYAGSGGPGGLVGSRMPYSSWDGPGPGTGGLY